MAPRTVRSRSGNSCRATFAGGVDRRAGLADHDLEDGGECVLGEEVAHEGIRLARGRAVADGDGTHVVRLHQAGEDLGGFGRLAGGRVDDVRSQEAAGLVDHGHLAAGAQAGVDAEHGDGSGGRGQQQMMEVIAKDRDGLGVAALLQLQPQFALDGGAEQARPAIVDGELQLRGPVAVGSQETLAEDAGRARSGGSSMRKYRTPSVSPRRMASMRCDGIVFTGSRKS